MSFLTAKWSHSFELRVWHVQAVCLSKPVFVTRISGMYHTPDPPATLKHTRSAWHKSQLFLCGYTLTQCQHNDLIKTKCFRTAYYPIQMRLRFGKLSWLGHLGCMADDRLPKKLLFCQVEGNRRPDHSHKSWLVWSGHDHIYMLRLVR